jgi:hypothetical protein
MYMRSQRSHTRFELLMYVQPTFANHIRGPPAVDGCVLRAQKQDTDLHRPSVRSLPLGMLSLVV